MQRIFPFLFIFFLFMDPMFMGLCSMTGIQNDGMVLRVYLSVVFSISLLSYWKIKGNVGFQRDVNLFIILSIFGGLYLLTTQFYGLVSGLFLGHFLRWGAQCVPAVLMGVAFVNYEEKEKIYKYIPLAVLFLTPFIALVSMTNNADSAQYVDEDSGLNYQMVAYNMALLFCTTAFYQFFCTNKNESKVLSISMYAMMSIQGVVCTMSGGRGGFVLLVVYIIYLIYMFLKKDLFSVSQLLVLISCCAIVFVLIANYVNLWDSAGFQRTIHPMAQNVGRVDHWREVLDIFYSSPFIGNGLGSNFYTWGFYSHNMFLDFLSETGIIGFVFFMIVFYKMETLIITLARNSDVIFFISIFALFGLVMNCFSGYWISDYYHWLILGIYYALMTREVDYLP